MQITHFEETNKLRQQIDELNAKKDKKEAEYNEFKAEWETRKSKLLDDAELSRQNRKELTEKLFSKSNEVNEIQIELEDYKNRLRIANEKSSTSVKELDDELEERTKELKLVKMELDTLSIQFKEEAEKARLIIKGVFIFFILIFNVDETSSANIRLPDVFFKDEKCFFINPYPTMIFS